eukprot:gene24053-32469_t
MLKGSLGLGNISNLRTAFRAVNRLIVWSAQNNLMLSTITQEDSTARQCLTAGASSGSDCSNSQHCVNEILSEAREIKIVDQRNMDIAIAPPITTVAAPSWESSQVSALEMLGPYVTRLYGRKCPDPKKLTDHNDATTTGGAETPRREIVFDVEVPMTSSAAVKSLEDREWEILFNFQLDYRTEHKMSVRKFLVLLGVSQPKSLEGFIWNSRTQIPSHQVGTKGFVFRQQLREFMEAHICVGESCLGSGTLEETAGAQVNAGLQNHNPSMKSSVLQVHTSAPLQIPQQQGDASTLLPETKYDRSTTPKLKRRSLVVDSDDDETTSACGTSSSHQMKKGKFLHRASKAESKDSDSSDCLDNENPIQPFESFNTPIARRCPLKLMDISPEKTEPKLHMGAPRTTHSNSRTLVSEQGLGIGQRGASHAGSRNAVYVTKKVLKVYLPVKDTPGVNFAGLLLGPRGESLKQLARCTGATIAIRGKGTCMDGSQSNRGHCDDGDDLHVALEGSENAVRLAYIEIRRIIDTAKLISDSRLELPQPEKTVSETANLTATYPEHTGTAIHGYGSAVTDPPLRGRGSHSQAAPHLAGRSPPPVPGRADYVTAKAIASHQITDKIKEAGVLGADTEKVEASTTRSDNKCSHRSNELVRAIQKHFPSHTAGDKGNRVVIQHQQQQPSGAPVQLVFTQTVSEKAASVTRTIRTPETVVVTAPEIALPKVDGIVADQKAAISCMPSKSHSSLEGASNGDSIKSAASSKITKPAPMFPNLNRDEFKVIATEGNCTACGKYGHSFDDCFFVRSNHANVNWDRSRPFSASKIGALYIARTKFSNLKAGVYVSTNQYNEREVSARSSVDNTANSGEIQRCCRNTKDILRNYYPDRPLNIDRALTFAEYEEGKARKDVSGALSRSGYAKKSSLFAIDSVALSEGSSRGCSLPSPSYHGDRNHYHSNLDRGHHADNQQYRGDAERWAADRTLYKHFPCTACGKYNHSYERCFFLRCKNLHPYINFDRTVDFMQSDIGKQYARHTGCKFLKADGGPNSGTDQYGREERRQDIAILREIFQLDFDIAVLSKFIYPYLKDKCKGLERLIDTAGFTIFVNRWNLGFNCLSQVADFAMSLEFGRLSKRGSHHLGTLK